MQMNLTGQMLGKYELRDLIGIGGMGAVYRGYDQTLKREVAVKVITLRPGEPDLQARFIREAQTAAGLEHSHIVRIYDYGFERDINYVVMHYLTGGSLSERMRQAGFQGRAQASLHEISVLLEHLASALDYAHTQGVIHRDIKPQNIMFNNQGQSFLVDFGIAKLLSATTNLTGTSTAIGTPSYMAPEQWGHVELTPAADQYALAVTTYQLAAGRLPFEADSVPSLWYKIENEAPEPLHTVRRDVPPALTPVIERALQKKPADRYPSCTAFSQAFTEAVAGLEENDTDYFTFRLNRSRSTATPFTPTSEIGKTPVGPTSPLQTSDAPPAPMPLAARGALVGGIAALALIGVLALLLVFVERGPSNSDMTVTALHQTLVAAGLAAERTASQESALTDAVTPAGSAVPSEGVPQPTDTIPASAVSPAPIATDEGTPTGTSTDAPTPTDAATATATATAPAASPTTTASPTTAATDTPSATRDASPTAGQSASRTPTLVARDLTETAIGQFNATQQAQLGRTITAALAATRAPALTATAAALADLRTQIEPGESNEDWSPVFAEFDGVDMALVPAGCFEMGGGPDEADAHTVCLDRPFWIDLTEVTQAQFAEFSGEGGRPPVAGGGALPVANVDWTEARNVCAARNGWLPTEAEWEYAARGPDGLTYPWGDDFDPDNAVYAGSDDDRPAATTGRRGASWVGARDLSGNVAEWTRSLYAPYPYNQTDGREADIDAEAAAPRVIRGGSWQDDADALRAFARGTRLPREAAGFIGFRCIRYYTQG